MLRKKSAYIKPAIEIIKVESEGVIASSGRVGGSQGNPGMSSSSYRRSYRGGGGNSASFNELEDLIEDILTIKD